MGVADRFWFSDWFITWNSTVKQLCTTYSKLPYTAFLKIHSPTEKIEWDLYLQMLAVALYRLSVFMSHPLRG